MVSARAFFRADLRLCVIPSKNVFDDNCNRFIGGQPDISNKYCNKDASFRNIFLKGCHRSGMELKYMCFHYTYFHMISGVKPLQTDRVATFQCSISIPTSSGLIQPVTGIRLQLLPRWDPQLQLLAMWSSLVLGTSGLIPYLIGNSTAVAIFHQPS